MNHPHVDPEFNAGFKHLVRDFLSMFKKKKKGKFKVPPSTVLVPTNLRYSRQKTKKKR